MESTLTAKGQTTVPAAARRKLGLRPGSRMVWTVEKDTLVVRASKDHAPQPSYYRLQGLLKHPKWKGDTDAWLKLVRGS